MLLSRIEADATGVAALPGGPVAPPLLAAADSPLAREGGPAPAGADALRIGGLTPFTTIDFPGRIAAVVFVQGCPWRCAYCHNPHLQHCDALPEGAPRWPQLRAWLRRRVGLIDGVVFSGGEPTADPALPAAMAEVRALGFLVGLHSAGAYPQRLMDVLPLAHWVGLDVKAPLRDPACHARVTGVRHGDVPVRKSLAALRDSGVAFECRTTVHPALLDEDALLALAGELGAAGVARWALQIARSTGPQGLPPVPAGWPAATTLRRLRERIAGLVLRAA